MLSYDALARRPAAFGALIGPGPDDFEALLADFLAAQDRRRRASTRTRRGAARRRGYGAGPTWTTATACCWP
jgi:hypothetical protein